MNERYGMAPLNVLLVDDDPEIATFIKLKLSREAPQFSFSFVESGTECLEYIKEKPVDCILSDFQMPGMDGMELLRSIREAGGDVPFIFLTGQGNEELAREAFKGGANDYFTKEIGFAHFTRIINSVEQAVNRRVAEMERKRSEDALFASQNFLETIIETEPECVKLVSPEGKLMMMNRAGLDMLEAGSLDDVKGEPISRFIVPEHLDAFNGVGEKVFQGGQASLEFEMVGLKGRRLRLETHAVPLRDGKGEIIALLGITRDITGRRKVEDALLAEKNKLEAILANIGDGVSIQDTDLRILYQNRAHIDMAGHHLGEYCYQAYEKKDRVCDVCPVAGALADGRVHTETKAVELDAVTRYFEITASPLKDADGKMIGGIEVVRDVTDRVNACEELKGSGTR